MNGCSRPYEIPYPERSSCTSCQMDQEAFRRGIQLFNEAEFFEAHDVLEDVWRAAPATEKRLLRKSRHWNVRFPRLREEYAKLQ